MDLGRTWVAVSMGKWDYEPLGDPGGRCESWTEVRQPTLGESRLWVYPNLGGGPNQSQVLFLKRK